MARYALSIIVILLSSTHLSSAQTSTSMNMAETTQMSMTASPTSEASETAANTAAETYTISVGYGGFKFTPNITYADPGDTITFQFFPSNHSVARSAYLAPCLPYEDTVNGKVGFWSGFEYVPAEVNDGPTYSVKVNNTEPVWFYCSAPGSCTQQGMIGVINPNSKADFERQETAALSSPLELSPGELTPAEASASMSRLMASMSTSMTMGTSASTSSPTAASTTSAPATITGGTSGGGGSHGLSSGAIAGIAIGAAVVLLLAAALFFFIGRSSSLKRTLKQQESAIQGQPYGHGSEMFQAGGTVFVPVKAGDLHAQNTSRSGHLSQGTYSAEPPGYPHSSAGDEVGSLRSAAGSPGIGAVAGRFHEGLDHRRQSQRSELGGWGHAPARSTGTASPPPQSVGRQDSRRGAHEMFAPLPGEEPQTRNPSDEKSDR